MKKFWPLLILVALLGAGSCASTGYVHYVIDAEHDSLRASDPKNDLPLRATCAPDAQNKAKCDAMLSEEFHKMELELLHLRQELKDCQAGPKPFGD